MKKKTRGRKRSVHEAMLKKYFECKGARISSARVAPEGIVIRFPETYGIYKIKKLVLTSAALAQIEAETIGLNPARK